jgi:2'-5' RNA ligase
MRIPALQYPCVHDLFYLKMYRLASDDPRLFLAVVPDTRTAALIYRLAGALKRAHGFSGKLIAPDRLHISLYFLGGLPDCMLSQVCRAIADTRMPSFELTLDRTVSFRGRPNSRPFVLLAGDEQPLRQLRSAIGAALVRAGLRRRANTNFTPHVTLLYDRRRADEHPMFEPIRLAVKQFVLVHSRNGHTHLERWPLRDHCSVPC